MSKSLTVILALLFALYSVPVCAELTPMGSPTAGNDAGTIPAWTGGITAPPPGYELGMSHPDPYADDSVLFTITADNVDEYADKLSAGHQALLRQYPTYKIQVYPSRRSTSLPQHVYDATRANSQTARLVNGFEGVAGATMGVPFPHATTAEELIWNHKLKYRGAGVHRMRNTATPNRAGQYSLVRMEEEAVVPYSKPGVTAAEVGDVHLYLLQMLHSPARMAGQIILVHETLDQSSVPRSAWTYNPGQRRVRRAPQIAYDSPASSSDGIRTYDQYDMFNGAMDRYDWRVVGQREMYVPYNAYQLHSDDRTVDEIIEPLHIEQDYARYELQRVWIVEATLKPGFRNIYGRRVFYIEWDSWQIVMADLYDSRDRLWRFSEAHPINYYEVPLVWTTLEVHYDLASGRYAALGLTNDDMVNDFTFDAPVSAFSPTTLRTRGRN